MNHYLGMRGPKGDAVVKLNGQPFDPARSQRVRNHSPSGFEWGYGGSGPAQLALAILLEEVDEESALNLYQGFSRDTRKNAPQNSNNSFGAMT